jgi:DNA-binding transcriptional regulator YiaG
MTTVNVNQGKAPPRGKKRPVRPARRVRASAVLSQRVREEYGLNRPLFARLLGVGATTMARWEKTGKLPKDAQAKIRQVADLLKGLSRVIPKADLAGWLTSPSDACRSAGEHSPADLMAKGRYDKIEAMIYFFESGVAY